jgi:flagellar hook-associated protein 3 FlgL
MRITQTILYDTFVNDIMRMQRSIYEYSKKLSSGKEVNAPSDDPVKTNAILTSDTLLANLNQYQRNIDSTLTYLATAEQTFSGTKDVLIRLQEVTAAMATGTVDANARSNSAIEVQTLLDQLISFGNTQVGGKYIFSGYLTDTAAFDAVGVYGGDTNKHQVRMDANSTVTIGVNGGEVFTGVGGGIDIYQAVTDLVTALNADDDAGVMTAIGTLETSFNQISDAVSDIGAKISRVNAASGNIENLQLRTRIHLSELEDVDIIDVVSRLQGTQAALEAALVSAGKVFNVNIFNYL